MYSNYACVESSPCAESHVSMPQRSEGPLQSLSLLVVLAVSSALWTVLRVVLLCWEVRENVIETVLLCARKKTGTVVAVHVRGCMACTIAINGEQWRIEYTGAWMRHMHRYARRGGRVAYEIGSTRLDLG